MPAEAPPRMSGLDGPDLARLKPLASRRLGTLSDDELALLEGLARRGLYASDAGILPEYCGAGFCDC